MTQSETIRLLSGKLTDGELLLLRERIRAWLIKTADIKREGDLEVGDGEMTHDANYYLLRERIRHWLSKKAPGRPGNRKARWPNFPH